jgi:hypothetical protein
VTGGSEGREGDPRAIQPEFPLARRQPVPMSDSHDAAWSNGWCCHAIFAGACRAVPAAPGNGARGMGGERIPLTPRRRLAYHPAAGGDCRYGARHRPSPFPKPTLLDPVRQAIRRNSKGSLAINDRVRNLADILAGADTGTGRDNRIIQTRISWSPTRPDCVANLAKRRSFQSLPAPPRAAIY